MKCLYVLILLLLFILKYSHYFELPSTQHWSAFSEASNKTPINIKRVKSALQICDNPSSNLCNDCALPEILSITVYTCSSF